MNPQPLDLKAMRERCEKEGMNHGYPREGTCFTCEMLVKVPRLLDEIESLRRVVDAVRAGAEHLEAGTGWEWFDEGPGKDILSALDTYDATTHKEPKP